MGSAFSSFATPPVAGRRLADPKLEGVAIDGMYKAGDTDAFLDGVVAVYPVRRRQDASGTVLLEIEIGAGTASVVGGIRRKRRRGLAI